MVCGGTSLLLLALTRYSTSHSCRRGSTSTFLLTMQPTTRRSYASIAVRGRGIRACRCNRRMSLVRYIYLIIDSGASRGSYRTGEARCYPLSEPRGIFRRISLREKSRNNFREIPAQEIFFSEKKIPRKYFFPRARKFREFFGNFANFCEKSRFSSRGKSVTFLRGSPDPPCTKADLDF